MPYHYSFVVVVASFATALVSAPPVFAASPIEVTACGQQIPHGGRGYLSADLTCPVGGDTVAIRLGGGAKLDLQGHTVTGGSTAIACGAVQCIGNACSPMRQSGACEISNGTITGAGYGGVTAGRAVLRNVTIIDNHAYGVLAFHRVEMFDSHVENSANGVQANSLVRATNSSFDAAPVQGGKKVVLNASSVTNGLSFGVTGTRVRLENGSTVVGNGTYVLCGQPDINCADILSERPPWFDGTSSCGTSLDTNTLAGGTTAVSWGVCLDD